MNNFQYLHTMVLCPSTESFHLPLKTIFLRREVEAKEAELFVSSGIHPDFKPRRLPKWPFFVQLDVIKGTKMGYFYCIYLWVLPMVEYFCDFLSDMQFNDGDFHVRDPDDRHEMEQHDSIRMFRIIQKEQNHSMLNGIQIFVKGILCLNIDVDTFMDGYNPFPIQAKSGFDFQRKSDVHSPPPTCHDHAGNRPQLLRLGTRVIKSAKNQKHLPKSDRGHLRYLL